MSGVTIQCMGQQQFFHKFDSRPTHFISRLFSGFIVIGTANSRCTKRSGPYPYCCPTLAAGHRPWLHRRCSTLACHIIHIGPFLKPCSRQMRLLKYHLINVEASRGLQRQPAGVLTSNYWCKINSPIDNEKHYAGNQVVRLIGVAASRRPQRRPEGVLMSNC